MPWQTAGPAGGLRSSRREGAGRPLTPVTNDGLPLQRRHAAALGRAGLFRLCCHSCVEVWIETMRRVSRCPGNVAWEPVAMCDSGKIGATIRRSIVHPPPWAASRRAREWSGLMAQRHDIQCRLHRSPTQSQMVRIVGVSVLVRPARFSSKNARVLCTRHIQLRRVRMIV